MINILILNYNLNFFTKTKTQRLRCFVSQPTEPIKLIEKFNVSGKVKIKHEKNLIKYKKPFTLLYFKST